MAKEFKTRCFYTEYVNHMIRFYLSCPDLLDVGGKKKADIENWIAVQAVFHALTDSERDLVTAVYRRNFHLPTAVQAIAEEKHIDPVGLWVILTRTAAAIARRRGLV